MHETPCLLGKPGSVDRTALSDGSDGELKELCLDEIFSLVPDRHRWLCDLRGEISWLTPIAIILVMALGAMAMANRMTWGWCIGAILGFRWRSRYRGASPGLFGRPNHSTISRP